MMSNSPGGPGRRSLGRDFCIALLIVAGVLAVLFFDSFSPEKVHFSNDSPLGVMKSHSPYVVDYLSGAWYSLNWLGTELVAAAPDISWLIFYLLGPVYNAKFFAALALLTLGMCAWLFFRQLRFAPGVCVVGGLAVALNSDYFSLACWGVATHTLSLGVNFLALAALADPSPRRRWVRLMLAGFAVGCGIMEGFDVGALFSLIVGSYALFQAVNGQPGPLPGRLIRGASRVALVAICAGVIAAQTLTSLVGTQIQGVVGTSETEKETKARWEFATQWSLPRIETLQIIIPGLFGYRMDTPNSGHYWGIIGGQPQVLEMMTSPDPAARAEVARLGADPANSNYFRFTGGGDYAGVLVVLVALWSGLQSARRQGSVFSLEQRRAIWFWSGLALIGLLLAYGKYAPFYRLFYSLPYASTIRNPAKFLHVFNWGILIIFTYGLQGLYRSYLVPSASGSGGVLTRFKTWQAKAPAFDQKWITGCFVAIGASLVGWMVYAGSANDLKAYLQTVAIGSGEAAQVAAFSSHAVGWFVLFLILAVTALALIFSGQFGGRRANAGLALLGLLVVTDLGRANLPWLIFWDYPYKYATNPVIDFLREKPYLNRVAVLPFRGQDEQSQLFGSLYGIEWNQHLFPYYDIQTLDIIQEPRETTDNNAFRSAIPVPGRGHPKADPKNFPRLWELTNTRYLLGAAGFAEGMNEQLDPQHRFRVLQRFSIAPKVTHPGPLTDFTAQSDTNGPLAIIEFTGALPRARLYANWIVETNATTTLAQLNNPAFQPAETVFVDRAPPVPPSATSKEAPGTVEIKPNYIPKRVELAADVKAPAVLLLNEKVDPRWEVFVDGKPDTLLHCNFIMRGVFLSPGKHDVVFQFAPRYRGLMISLASIAVALGLVGFLLIFPGKPEPGEATDGVTAANPSRKDNSRRDPTSKK